MLENTCCVDVRFTLTISLNPSLLDVSIGRSISKITQDASYADANVEVNRVSPRAQTRRAHKQERVKRTSTELLGGHVFPVHCHWLDTFVGTKRGVSST